MQAAGEVSVVDWQARNIHLKVNMAHEANILVRQFYYPGWQATLSQSDTHLPLESTGKMGLIKLIAPPGQHDIGLILRPLWQEVAGKVVSVIGLLVVIILLASRRLQRIYQQDAGDTLTKQASESLPEKDSSTAANSGQDQSTSGR